MSLRGGIADGLILVAGLVLAPATVPPAASAAPAAACAPAPRLVLGAAFRDPRGIFAPAAPAFRTTAANFAAAWRRACDGGLLGGDRLFREVQHRDRLVLHNAPDANVASIYPQPGVPASGRSLRLEYPFLASDGSTNVPDAEALHEAIYCYVRGATAQEQEEEGRCLPD